MATSPTTHHGLIEYTRAASTTSFDVHEREYTARSNFRKNADQLKNSWESAPKGRVYFLSREVGRPQDFGDGIIDSPRPQSKHNGEGGGDDPRMPLLSTDYNAKDAGDSHYTPGVSQDSLNELQATSIAGNDITSSCLYATGIVVTAAGKYSPFSSALVCLVLYFFRRIYSEVFSAIPMNGGTYTALLNTSSKNMAALAAILSTISYTATAVTSAASAGDYLNYQWPAVPSEWVCIGILLLFALLTLMGIKDSANTAAALFIIHVSTMMALIIAALVFVIKDGGETLKNSWNSTSPQASPQANAMTNLFFGYCTALLGVTGFESSSNYIEEQKPGVFPKTLRNMWIAITAINPALAVLSMGVVPIEVLVDNANYSLALVGEMCVGPWFRTLIAVDAALVLAGAVLTAYVGITGMHRRLALDRIMPNFFLNVNSFRKTNHWIIIVFAILTCSLRLLVNDMNVLGGVYAIAFLGVMALFCLSNFFLKFRRGKLPRSPIAHPLIVFIAMSAVLVGAGGNIAKDPVNAGWFGFYFAIFGFGVLVTMQRVTVLRLLVRGVPRKYPRIRELLERKVHELRQFPVVFFVKDPNLHVMNKAIGYISKSEETRCIKIVHMESIVPLPSGPSSTIGSPNRSSTPTADPPLRRAATDTTDTTDPCVVVLPADGGTVLDPLSDPEMLRGGLPVPDASRGSLNADGTLEEPSAAEVRALARNRTRKELEEFCAVLDELYPKISIDIVFVDHDFGPESVHHLSEKLNIPRNYMFMTCPSDKFNHTIGHLGGVRVILH
ncbi:amino acid permease, putative [Bodo saltans]|uniref:Amino acid permease, putative n=1 Tax=Bodo saltans TaxID=75058 RepID=A0A0S4JPA4_BODSA|nr:amino acid permease, putative [Bodo saltans]|eukprot:CUG91104.1 amino acid permease, putative [Bodo saltans]